jgi:hypothetical protein
MSDAGDLIRRIETLERSQRRLTRENRVLKGLAAAVGLAALTVLVLGHRQGALADEKKADAEEKKLRVVEAEKFLLKDSDKNIRAALFMGKHGPKYDLYDEKGTLRATLALSVKESPALVFFGPDSQQEVILTSVENKRILLFQGPKGESRVTLAYNEKGAVLSFNNEKGDSRTMLTDNPQGRGLALLDDGGKTRLSAVIEKSKPSLQILDSDEKPVFQKP